MTAPDSPMVERLKAVEAAFEVVSPDAVLNGKSRVLVDAAAVREAAPARVADWAAAIEAGAVMTVAEAGPADAGWLGELAGRPVSFSVPPYGTWDGRGMRTAWTPLTAGLSQMDQYWKRFDSAQNAGGQAEDTQYVIEPFQEYAVSVSGAGVIESVWPGALVELSRGAGRLALDQRNLYTSHPNLTLAPDRSVSALALGMGGRLAAAVEYPEMPATVAYRPIALDAWVNRALMDEIPEDGQGGWTDQGSGADLREFPTRNRRLAGVPFVFAPGTNKCIVLRNARRPFPERLPQGVTLPVGQAVAGLYFLHAAAYGGRPSAVYEIQYEDGTRNAIALMMGKNIADWVNAAAELPRERGTRSILAWTGRTPRFSRVGVYRMEWVNPHPEKTVAAVRFYKPEKTGGVPILMALTAAVPAGAGGVGPAAADRARAVALAVEAAAALKAGDLTRAAGLVAGALALDEGCEDAYAVRGDLADKSGREDERLAVYQDWIDTGATRPRPYNEVGAILEKRGNLRGALDAYRQSLKVEWNQPPTIEIRSRLEQQVK
jgi:Tfp pilus assembly protein PilF